MLLIDFVLVITGQREYIRAEVVRGIDLAGVIGNHLSYQEQKGRPFLNESDKRIVSEILLKVGYICAVIIDPEGRETFVGDLSTEREQKIINLIQKSIIEKKDQSFLLGDTWGVFWRQEQNILIATPVFNGEKAITGIGLIFPLNGYYERIRISQRLVLFYIFTNAIILSLFGLYRMYQITLKPINRLVKKAEEYKEDHGFGSIYEKEENEIGSLSKALNRMLMRISEDKQSLKASLSSLEKANIELKKVQQEIIRAEKLASVGRLAAGIAHEIGNPIGIVLGYLGLMKHTSVSAEEREDFIARSENEIKRIKTIIRQLLDFSRPASNCFAAISAHQVIEETVSLLKVQPLMNRIKSELFLIAENDMVWMDPNQLRQILINLLLNAADAINEKGNVYDGLIRIETENKTDLKAESLLTVRIIDNGTGIPYSYIHNIFDPFFSTKEPGNGTGLGLSVCFMILEQIGGTIQAGNNKSGGTVMTVSLPLNQSPKTMN